MANVNYPAIYREELARLEYGVPNYYPDEPGPPTEEIQIGDVGFFLPGGQFKRLFNVTRPEGDPLNEWGVPEKFEVLEIHDICVHESPDFLNAGPICSGTIRRVTGGVGAQGLSVAGAGIRLHCSKDQGAFLILQTSGSQKKVVENEWIGEYMINHRDNWHNFAKHHFKVSKNDFVLISGFVKTTNWALGAFSKRSIEMTIDISGELGPTAQAGINVEFENTSYSSVQPRVGPSSRMIRRSSSSGHQSITPSLTMPIPQNMARVPLPPKNPNEDQAVFLSYYQAKDRFAFLPTKVIAHAEPKDEHGDDENAPEGPAAVIVEHHPSQETPFPSLLDDALQFILNYSDAEVAVTSTTHLHCLLGDGEWPEDMISTLRAFAPDITVNEQTKAGSFSMRHLLMRQYAARAAAQPQPHPAHLPAAEPMEVENVGDTNPEAGPSTSPTTSDEKAPENPVPRPGTNGQFIIGKLEGDTFLWPHLLFSEADEAEAGAACHAIFSPDGRSVAAGYEDAVVRVWDVETGVLDHRLEKHELSIVALAFSPDSSKLASGSSDAAVILWELNEDLEIATLQHDGSLWCLAWSPDGEVIATGTIEFTVTLWSTLSCQRIAILPSHASLIQHISFSPDSCHLLSVSQNIASIWDAKTGEAVSQLDGHMNVIWCAAFSPDGNRVVTGGEDSTTRIWDSKTGDELVIIREHTNPVWAVEFSPDGQDVLSGSYDSTISVCNSYTGERQHLLRRQASTVTSATYSPDGAFISSGYADGSVNVWDTKKGSLMAELKGHEDKVKSVQYSRNGRNIVSSSDDGTVRVWSMVDVLKLVHLA